MNTFKLKACVLVLASIYQSNAVADITNGSFENGLTGWTTLTSGSANAVTLATGTTNATAGTLQASPTSDQYVYTSQTGPGYSILYQNFNVQSGVNKVFFDIAINNSAAAFHTPDSLDYNGASNQQARFEILKPGASPTSTNPNDIIVVVYRTQVGDANTQAWTTKQVDVTSALSSYIGQNVIFRFSQVDNSGYFNLALDNINVGAAQFAQLLSTLSSSQIAGNNPALGAARVIDGNATLLSQFAGISGGDRAVSNAVSQTLPLLTGGQSHAMANAMTGANNVIQARQEGAQGRSSGDVFLGDEHVWFKPFGSWANQDDRKGVSGFDSNTYGMVFGVDGAVSDKNRLGAAFAYARSDINGNSSVAQQSSKVDTYQIALYGSRSLTESTDVNFQADIGRHDTEGKRELLFAGSTARSDYHTWSAHIGGGIAHTITFNERTSFTPSVRADYTVLREDSYKEKGADIFNLNVSSNRTEALVFGVDGKVAHKLNDSVTLTGNLGVGYDVINERASITSTYAGAPTAAFVTKGLDPSPWMTRGGLGVVTKANERLEIAARYDVEVRESFDNQTASVKVRWAF